MLNIYLILAKPECRDLTMSTIIYDVEGIDRYVVGFDKVPDEDGDHYQKVEFDLEPMDLNFLRKIFNVDMNSDDPGILDIIDPLNINEYQAKLLNLYVIGGVIDTKLYNFELHCCQKAGYDWSEGYGRKIEE
jgi:hypothetical protein